MKKKKGKRRARRREIRITEVEDETESDGIRKCRLTSRRPLSARE